MANHRAIWINLYLAVKAIATKVDKPAFLLKHPSFNPCEHRLSPVFGMH